MEFKHILVNTAVVIDSLIFKQTDFNAVIHIKKILTENLLFNKNNYLI